MIKRICIVLLTLSLFVNSSSVVLACNEEQTNLYVTQIIFGDDALLYEADKNVEEILSALYICSEQSNRDGKDKLDLLKDAKVSGIPGLDKINVSDEYLLSCSHNTWEYEAKGLEKLQAERKDVLRNTVIKVFDFGWINETFKKSSGQIDSFSALLYYFHILADYLADDPDDTEFSVKGYDIPAYSGITTVELNGNNPQFSSVQKKSTEFYMKFEGLDGFGRTGTALANLDKEHLAPSDSRQNIGNIKPSGWNQEKYEGLVNSKPPYVYNRCHLIAHQLIKCDEQVNLITGTRYLNEAMIPYENEVATYVKNTGNHVLYRATPVYVGDNLVASGVQLEGYSVEDKGAGICFNVYLYNVQPGVDINYANGKNERADQIYGNNGIIPFATMNPSDQNPDLMYEIKKQLEKLFVQQNETAYFKSMINDLELIAVEARNVSGGTDAKTYIKLKKYQYEYIEALSEYVPKLLDNEEFFDIK